MANATAACLVKVQDAGVAYKQCGRLEEKLKNPEVAASFYHEAALCFQKDDPQGITARGSSTSYSEYNSRSVPPSPKHR